MHIGARLVELPDRQVHAIGATPLVVGRDPEADVRVAGDDISRRHAYFLRTPQGIVVVDTSTNGTFVNGERVQAERLLAAGDTLQIGGRSFVFEDGGSSGRPHYSPDLAVSTTSDPPSMRRVRRRSGTRDVAGLAARPSWPVRMRSWLRRYAVGEVVGLGTALAAAWLVDAATDSEVATAFGASIGESVGYYGAIVVRELVQDAYAAGSRRVPYGVSQMAATWRCLLLEFGPAEVVDTLVLRPFTMWLGQDALGLPFGILAGKLAADLGFYAPVILMYELRRARGDRRP